MGSSSLKAFQKKREPLTMSRERMTQLANEVIEQKKDQIRLEVSSECALTGALNMQLLMLEALQDEFSFGKQRLERLLNRVNYKLSCCSDGFHDVSDIYALLSKQGIHPEQEGSLPEWAVSLCKELKEVLP